MRRVCCDVGGFHQCLPTLAGGGQSTSQRLRAILERQATVLMCTPTYALRLAEAAAEKGLDTLPGGFGAGQSDAEKVQIEVRI